MGPEVGKPVVQKRHIEALGEETSSFEHRVTRLALIKIQAEGRDSAR
jgi:hypothetical protein